MSRLIIFLLLAVTACSSDLVQLREIEPKGNLYQTYLAKEYLDYSDAEARQYDWSSSGYFADKGLDAANGKYVAPEDLRDWDIPEDNLPTMTQARAQLIQIMDSGSSTTYPKESAKLLFYFDCWVEQEDEKWQEDHINYCRENFYITLDDLFLKTTADREKYLAQVKAEEEQKIAAQAVAKIEPDNINIVEEGGCSADCITTVDTKTVYFDFNRFNLSKRTKLVIKKVAEGLKGKSRYAITLNGYADRVGGEDYNMNLSRKRAVAVKKELIAHGIKESAITVFAFGEVHGLLETPDNIKEAENRAVEIVVEM